MLVRRYALATQELERPALKLALMEMRAAAELVRSQRGGEENLPVETIVWSRKERKTASVSARKTMMICLSKVSVQVSAKGD